MTIFKPKSEREVMLIRTIRDDPTLTYFTVDAVREKDESHHLYLNQKRIIVAAWATVFKRLRHYMQR